MTLPDLAREHTTRRLAATSNNQYDYVNMMMTMSNAADLGPALPPIISSIPRRYYAACASSAAGDRRDEQLAEVGIDATRGNMYPTSEQPPHMTQRHAWHAPTMMTQRMSAVSPRLQPPNHVSKADRTGVAAPIVLDDPSGFALLQGAPGGETEQVRHSGMNTPANLSGWRLDPQVLEHDPAVGSHDQERRTTDGRHDNFVIDHIHPTTRRPTKHM